MSAPQFAPGPWSIVPYGDERRTSLVIHYSPQNRVCFMSTPGENHDEDRARIEANARLIAAAPDLHTALQKARKIVQAERDCLVECATVGPEHDLRTLDPWSKPAVEKLDAVLAEIDAALAKVADR